jgi:dTMP kinase
MANGPIPGGLLIAVEGIDGAGKTTLARALGEGFRRAGIPVKASKEPTQGPWGSILRASAAEGRLTPQEELRYLLRDREQHVQQLIKPALHDDEVVILDRYYPSNVAYQGAAGLDVADLLAQNAFAPVPDLVLVLDLEPTEGLRRIRARGDQPNHFETEDALHASRAIFLTMELPTRVVLDASQSIADVERASWHAIFRAASKKANEAYGFDVEAGEALLAVMQANPEAAQSIELRVLP